ncbi:MAG: flagellar filament outer layer protein FlaA [Treponema sp.]|nr:flagellar filament outer layer protein FlaA [Treponema sp.]
MKKYSLLVLLALCSAGLVFAQSSLSDPDPSNVGNDSAASALREVSVDKFEREGSWNVRMSPDAGVVRGRIFEGAPAAKEALDDDKDTSEDTHVFGVKAEFYRRGINSIYVRAARPIPIEGVTKTVSVWIAGRNLSHELTLLVQDYFGNNYEIYMGPMSFSGWKKMTVAIPPSPDGVHGIVQSSVYYGDRPGLRIVGFRIDCNPETAIGSYYVYFDGLRAVTDLYDLENRDSDDMSDNW